MVAYVPSYANPLPTFQPAMRVIAGISNASPVLITTTFAHQYITNTIVRLDIPPSFGMQALNQQFGPITVISPTTFTMPIDATNLEPFVLPTTFPPGYQDAQVVPISEVNSLLAAATQNVLPYSAT